MTFTLQGSIVLIDFTINYNALFSLDTKNNDSEITLRCNGINENINFNINTNDNNYDNKLTCY